MSGGCSAIPLKSDASPNGCARPIAHSACFRSTDVRAWNFGSATIALPELRTLARNAATPSCANAASSSESEPFAGTAINICSSLPRYGNARRVAPACSPQRAAAIAVIVGTSMVAPPAIANGAGCVDRNGVCHFARK